MSFLKRLFSSNTPAPMQRVRICVECGMPVAEHKDWCSIRRGQVEMERRKAERHLTAQRDGGIYATRAKCRQKSGEHSDASKQCQDSAERDRVQRADVV